MDMILVDKLQTLSKEIIAEANAELDDVRRISLVSIAIGVDRATTVVLDHTKQEDHDPGLFHECPLCNGRCNCFTYPCSCDCREDS